MPPSTAPPAPSAPPEYDRQREEPSSDAFAAPSAPTYQPATSAFRSDGLYQPVAPAYTPSTPSPLDLGSYNGSGGGLVNIGTPIFDSVSAWFSSGGGSTWASLDDEAWQEASRRAAATPSVEGSTSAGLPRRRPGANTVPSASEMSRSAFFGAASGNLDADSVRSRLGGFQDGLRNARRLRGDFSEPIAFEAAAAVEAVHETNGTSFGPWTESGTPAGPQFEAPPAPTTSQGPPLQTWPQQFAGGRDAESPETGREAEQSSPLPQTQPRSSSTTVSDGTPSSSSTANGRPSEARGFGAFYRDYLPQLLAMLMVEGARPGLAAEIAQDVMSAAYREWARIDSPRDWARERAMAAWAERHESDASDDS
jgi:hypothetical protein